MADENVGLDLASQTGQENIVEAINGLKNLLSRLSDLLTLGSKTVTQNGIYNPADDGFDGYSQVDVNIQLYTNDTIDGVNVYRPTKSGLIVSPEGYAGFGNLLIDESAVSNEYFYAIDFQPNSNANTALSGGFSFIPKRNLTVSGIRFYARDTEASVFLSDDTVVYSKENVQVSSDQWNDILFDEPITLMNNSNYTVWGSNHNTPMKYYNSGYTNTSFIKNISNKYGSTRFQKPNNSETNALYGIDLIITNVDYS